MSHNLLNFCLWHKNTIASTAKQAQLPNFSRDIPRQKQAAHNELLRCFLSPCDIFSAASEGYTLLLDCSAKAAAIRSCMRKALLDFYCTHICSCRKISHHVQCRKSCLRTLFIHKLYHLLRIRKRSLLRLLCNRRLWCFRANNTFLFIVSSLMSVL